MLCDCCARQCCCNVILLLYIPFVRHRVHMVFRASYTNLHDSLIGWPMAAPLTQGKHSHCRRCRRRRVAVATAATYSQIYSHSCLMY